MITNLKTPAILVLAGSVILFLYTLWVGIDRVHILGLYEALNDQASHLDAARNLAFRNTLTSGIIYTSVVDQEFATNYFYMPGPVVLTALFLKIMGDTALAAFAPNMLAYLVGILLVYFIGLRLAGRQAGVAAAILFMAFPIHVILAVSAMTDMTFVVTMLIAFFAFLVLPGTYRPIGGAVGLGLVYFFKEPGILWIVPMAIMLMTERNNRLRHVRVIGLGIATLLFLYAVSQLDWIQGRPSRLGLNMLGQSFEELYCDAFASKARFPDVATDWAPVLLARSLENLRELGSILARPSLESISLHAILWPSILLGLLALTDMFKGIRHLAIALLLMAMTLFVFFTVIYIWDSFGAVRLLLIIYPLQCVLMGAALAGMIKKPVGRWSATVVILAASLGLLFIQARSIRRSDIEMVARARALYKVQPDPRGILISPWEWGPVYIYENFPVKWAFIPANAETFRLLHQKHPVATAVLDHNHIDRIGLDILASAGLAQDGVAEGPDGKTYLIFRRQHHGDQTNKGAQP